MHEYWMICFFGFKSANKINNMMSEINKLSFSQGSKSFHATQLTIYIKWDCDEIIVCVVFAPIIDWVFV